MDLPRMAQDLVLTPITDAAILALRFLPHVGIAALVLLVGFPLAVLAREITARLLRAAGIDVLSEKTGFTGLLQKGGISRRPSRALGLLAYWVIVFSALILVFNVLDIPAGAKLIQQVLGLLPKFLAILVIVSLGIFLGRFMGRIVQASSLIANVPFAAVLGRLAAYGIVGISLLGALRFVELVPESLTGALAAIAIAAPVVAGVGVLLASPRTMSSIVAGRFLRDQIKPGDRISFDGISGTVQAVHLVSTRLRDGADDIIVANADLAARIIRRLEARDPRAGNSKSRAAGSGRRPAAPSARKP
jgi:small-conductance mechanosensitive channel